MSIITWGEPWVINSQFEYFQTAYFQSGRANTPCRGYDGVRTVMTTYVPVEQQLVVEIFVRDASRAKAFYQKLGFEVSEDRGTFVVLTWEGHELFLDQRSSLSTAPSVPQANVRVMVADVDAYWARAQALGAQVLAPIADREYGLRDFTILDPDGFGLRFGSRLEDQPTPSSA